MVPLVLPPFTVEQLAWLDHMIEVWMSERRDTLPTPKPGQLSLAMAASQASICTFLFVVGGRVITAWHELRSSQSH